jgi:hypothetical protein
MLLHPIFLLSSSFILNSNHIIYIEGTSAKTNLDYINALILKQYYLQI